MAKKSVRTRGQYADVRNSAEAALRGGMTPGGVLRFLEDRVKA